MATRKSKTETPSMKDLVPGAMPEAMVKGCLVDETDADHGTVASWGWGFAIKALIKARGGNYTYNDAYESGFEPEEYIEPDTSTTSPALVAEAEAEDDDFSDLAEFDDIEEDEPEVETIEEVAAKASKILSGVVNDIEDAPLPEEAGAPLFIGMPSTKDYIFDGHAGAGPSGAERWMTCTASLGASRAFLETLTANQQREFAKSGTAARQGTTAHAAAESEARLMLGQITEAEHDNNILDLTFTPESDAEAYNDEMGEWITEYGDLVKQYHQSGHEILIEQRVETAVELMTVTKGERDVHVIEGSLDFAALPLFTTRKSKKKDENVLTVGDLKYGNGIFVEADDNSQTKIYAIGILGLLAERGEDIFAIDRVDLIIVQPRLGGIKTWSTTVDDLLDWRDDVLSPALTEALGGLKGGAKFVPGEVQCQWCPARGGCAALAEARMTQGAELFDTITEAEFNKEEFPETGTLTDERLATLYSQIAALTDIKDDLKAELQRRLHRGNSVPGFHLVNYSPPRSWSDEDKIPDKIAKQLQVTKMMSPTQATKLLKGDEAALATIEPLIVVPEKRPVVAPVTDKRKPWEGKPPESMFADETGEQ